MSSIKTVNKMHGYLKRVLTVETPPVDRGVLPTIWYRLLAELRLKPDRWSMLMSKWRDQQVDVIGKEKAIALKTNLSNVLASDNLTWNRLELGLQVLNADSRYKAITITIALTDMDDNVHAVTEAIVTSKVNGVHGEDPGGGNPSAGTLSPNDTAVPNKWYILKGFDVKVDGELVRYTGTTPLSVPKGSFDDVTIVAGLILTSSLKPSSLWSKCSQTWDEG